MVFSSVLFLFLFLPLTLFFYFVAGTRLKNYILLAASLLFYAWGEMGYVLLMLFSITVNYLFGIMINRSSDGRWLLAIGITINLIPLVMFKYGNFLVDNGNWLLVAAALEPVSLAPVHLPIGISFFTFQAISYIVDVYRKQADAQYRPANLALYIALFPQLIAGPIVRYRDVALQIGERSVKFADFQYGAQRFVTGLGKKVLIANTVAALADHVFALPSNSLPAHFLWLGMLCYTLQIYYDFSGYSDMAIGLGRMFGFRFLENFNYPYAATSIQDFWHRWHISLSTWFRDYLYIPLGGSRKGEARTYLNLLIVFFLCGLWHGASWNFVIWGLYHGFFLVVERLGLGALLGRMPRLLGHMYTLLVISVGWVFFRAETLTGALQYLAGLANFHMPPYLDAMLFGAINRQFYLTLPIAVLFIFPIWPQLRCIFATYCQKTAGTLPPSARLVYGCAQTSWMALVYLVCAAQLLSGTHNPFIYFRF